MKKDSWVNDFLISEKALGKCSFCKQDVHPKPLMAGLLKRDMCICSNEDCSRKLVVCFTFGCDNYAKAGFLVQQPLCTWCAGSVTKFGGKILGVAAAVSVTVLMKDYLNKEK